MKTLVTYYSFSGNTDIVMKIFSAILGQEGEVITQRLKQKDEIKEFGAQCKAAFLKKRAQLEDGVRFDASPYDLIVLGSPVWAFAPVPAVNTFLDNVNGLTGKKAIVVITSGSGLGVKRCFRNIETVLRNKGITDVDFINIPDRKVRDTRFVEETLKRVI